MQTQKKTKNCATIKDERGQGLIEYLLLTALLAIAALGVVRILGQSVTARFTDVTNAIQGGEYRRTPVERVDERYYRKRDMSDFMRGAVQREERE